MAGKKSGIHIKPSHRGRFTNWCKAHGYGGPGSECIQAALKKGGNAAKMANFARNAKGWKH